VPRRGVVDEETMFVHRRVLGALAPLLFSLLAGCSAP
jgi:hypothetical protein